MSRNKHRKALYDLSRELCNLWPKTQQYLGRFDRWFQLVHENNLKFAEQFYLESAIELLTLSTFYEAFYHKCLELIHDILGNVFYKLQQPYYKRGKVLQSGETCKWGSFVLLQSGARTFTKWDWPSIRNWDNFIKQWVKYYKVGELLQSRPVHN